MTDGTHKRRIFYGGGSSKKKKKRKWKKLRKSIPTLENLDIKERAAETFFY